MGSRLHVPRRTCSHGKTVPVHSGANARRVLAVLTKRKAVSEVCRELQVSETSFKRWREQALEAIDEVMKDKAERGTGGTDVELRLAEAERTIGRLALENELFGRASRWLT